MNDKNIEDAENFEIESRATEKTDAIRERTFNFAVRIVKLCK